MDQPEPADGWPNRPLSEAEATALLGVDGGEQHVDTADIEIDPAALLSPVGEPTGVWVMDHESEVRSAAVGGSDPDDAVIDVVVETREAFEMFSYTRGQWVDYGQQRRDDEDAPSMAGTLDSYRLLAGESTLDDASPNE